MENIPVLGRIFLKKGKEEILKNYHSWIFSGAVKKIETNSHIKNGDILEVRGYNNQLLGYAFYEKEEQIVARVFYFLDPEKSSGQLDIHRYFYTKLEAIFHRKSNLFPDSTSFRFLHSESDGIPGIICDIYQDLAVIQIDYLYPRALIPMIIDFLKEKNIAHILLKKEKQVEWLTEKKESINFLENRLSINLDLSRFQKTGYFLDQKLNRKKLKHYVKEKVVLDAFCYTGTFGLNALHYGAKKVDFVDSKDTSQIIKKNLFQNGFYVDQFEYYRENVLEFLQRIPGNHYDVMVLDPPAFVKTKTQLPDGLKGYIKLNTLAMQKIKNGGVLFTFSCSQLVDKETFRKVMFISAREAKRKVILLDYLTQSPDHTISIFHPEGEYLKGYVLYVEDEV